MKVRLTPEAKADLEGIGDRIAERNPARAVTYVRELRERAGRIGEFPHSGPPRPQWGEGIRIAIHAKYLIEVFTASEASYGYVFYVLRRL